MYKAYKYTVGILFVIIAILMFSYTFRFSLGLGNDASDPESNIVTGASITSIRTLPAKIWILFGVFVIITLILGSFIKKREEIKSSFGKKIYDQDVDNDIAAYGKKTYDPKSDNPRYDSGMADATDDISSYGKKSEKNDPIDELYDSFLK